MAETTPRKPHTTTPDLTLVKYLVSAGVGSRRHSAELVVSGDVKVNGERAESITLPVRARDRVEVEGRLVRMQTAPYVYMLVNKPIGYVSTVRDDRGRPTVMDLVPQAKRVPGLVPAGRLDLDSSGLMLLTNDGELLHRVTHPRYGVRKEYRVLLDAPVSGGTVTALLRGVKTFVGVARALAVRRVSRDPTVPLYNVTLIEGKNREIRLMFRAVGRMVEELERTDIGNLSIAGLGAGESRELTTLELRRLRLDAHEIGTAPGGDRGHRPARSTSRASSAVQGGRAPRQRAATRSANGGKPASGGGKPASGGGKPASSGRKPASSGRKPPGGGSRPPSRRRSG